MSFDGREPALSSLKAMQTEITAIRYYSKKLSSIKKDIDETVIDAADYKLNRADELKANQSKYLKVQKEAPAKTAVFDALLMVVFAVFALALMVILHPGEKVNILGGVVNWIFHGIFVIYPLTIAARLILSKADKFFAGLPNGARLALLIVYGVSVVAYIVTSVFRPIFLISVIPLLFGALVYWLKSKENARIAKATYDGNVKNARARFAKMLREAEESDAIELQRYEADLEKAKKAKEVKLSAVIKECSTALSKHKANFKEIKIIPDEMLQRDMKVVDTLIAILESGKARSIDEAIAVYEDERNNSFGEIYVYVGIRRRDGWSTLRNLVYLDGEKHLSAEMPYSVIKVSPGKHTLSAKVQLNYDGAAHYPASETLDFDIADGDKKYVKFFVKGTPTVQHVICSGEEEFNNQL